MKNRVCILLIVVVAVNLLMGCNFRNNETESFTQNKEKSSQSLLEQEIQNDDQGKIPSDGSLKLVLGRTDGAAKNNQLPSPWLNRTMVSNLTFRSLFLADSSLMNVSPDLAEEYEISEDGMTYQITLKQGLKWSDGESLDMEDVVFSIQTAQKASVVNSIYTAAFSLIKNMQIDGNVLTIKLLKPYAAMIPVLAQFAILPEHVLKEADPATMESNDFWKNPVTSGMYLMDEFGDDDFFTLKINENYEGTKPKISKVVVTFVSDYVAAAKAGKADYVYGNSKDLVRAFSGMIDFDSIPVDALFYKYFIFNMKGIDGTENKAMQNVKVRQALISAIDRAALAVLYPSANLLNSGVPNNYEAYNGFTYSFDSVKAKEELVMAGYDMNRTLRLCYYNNDQTSIDLMAAVKNYLEQIGLKVEVTLSDNGTTDLFTTREYDIGFKGKSAFSIDEWYTEYIGTDQLFSKIFGGDSSFDGLITELFASTTEDKRNAVLVKLQALEQEKVYKVPVFTVGNYVFLSHNVIIPSNVSFCNPLYSCDLDYENWEIK